MPITTEHTAVGRQRTADVDGLPAPAGHTICDVATLAYLLELTSTFDSNAQRARYLLGATGCGTTSPG